MSYKMEGIFLLSRNILLFNLNINVVHYDKNTLNDFEFLQNLIKKNVV